MGVYNGAQGNIYKLFFFWLNIFCSLLCTITATNDMMFIHKYIHTYVCMYTVLACKSIRRSYNKICEKNETGRFGEESM